VKADERFHKQPPRFWATVRLVSQIAGYTTKKTRKQPSRIKVLSVGEIAEALRQSQLDPRHVLNAEGEGNELGVLLEAYFKYRAHVLNNIVRPNLMLLEDAKREYNTLKRKFPRTKVQEVLNKQKGEKKGPNYFTCMVNLLIEGAIGEFTCNYDPRQLTTITKDGIPVRTLARRVDGAFPAVVNPIAVWEIKEYYYTTTFGSRVADGVYETLLDGMELENLAEHEHIEVLHYLFVDAYRTWWDDGKSYLCRMIDMLHMNYVDEVLFGREIFTRLPELAKQWAAKVEARDAAFQDRTADRAE
jgi:hypothetical protein